MSDYIKVALDCNGGDNAPAEIVKGAMEALKESTNIQIVMLGTEDVFSHIPKEMENDPRIIKRVTTEVIETAEHPVHAIRSKKDSSIVVGMNMLKAKEVDSFVSAGSTGAVLAGGQFLAGKLPAVKRTPLATLIPTKKGNSLLIDCGASVDAKPEYLLQFAMMGTVYMEGILGIKKPTVAIVNIGAEEEKGNKLVKDTMPLLKECQDINFIGSIEARDIPFGYADIIVCDAFVGNVILKMYEGVSASIMDMVKEVFTGSFVTKLGAALVYGPLKKRLKVLKASDHGGAPLLGIDGLIVKTHGNSQSVEIKNSILQCELFKNQGVTEKMRELFSK